MCSFGGFVVPKGLLYDVDVLFFFVVASFFKVYRCTKTKTKGQPLKTCFGSCSYYSKRLRANNFSFLRVFWHLSRSFSALGSMRTTERRMSGRTGDLFLWF